MGSLPHTKVALSSKPVAIALGFEDNVGSSFHDYTRAEANLSFIGNLYMNSSIERSVCTHQMALQGKKLTGIFNGEAFIKRTGACPTWCSSV